MTIRTFFRILTTGEIGIQSAPVVAKDTVIIGAAFREGMTPKSMRNNKGYVRDSMCEPASGSGFSIPSQEGRVWLRHLGQGLGRIYRQHRRVDPNHRG